MNSVFPHPSLAKLASLVKLWLSRPPRGQENRAHKRGRFIRENHQKILLFDKFWGIIIKKQKALPWQIK